jgi:hypothetical protein
MTQSVSAAEDEKTTGAHYRFFSSCNTIRKEVFGTRQRDSFDVRYTNPIETKGADRCQKQ